MVNTLGFSLYGFCWNYSTLLLITKADVDNMQIHECGWAPTKLSLGMQAAGWIRSMGCSLLTPDLDYQHLSDIMLVLF